MQSTPPNKNSQYSQSRILPTDITCRKCGNSYPETPEHWYFQDGIMKKPCKECHKAAERARQAIYRKNKKAKQIDPRPCRYCGKMFRPITRQANRRNHCYRVDCIKRGWRQYDPQKRAATRRWKVKNGHTKPTLKVCPLCGKRRMEAQDHFSCKACRVQAYKSGRCDGDYMYLPSIGYEEEAHERAH